MMMDVGAVEQVDPSAPDIAHFTLLPGATRFRWYACATAVSTPQQAWNELIGDKSAIDDQINTQPVVILGHVPPSNNDCAGNRVAEISVIGDNPDEVNLQVRADNPGWLFQADTWYPGWIAQVDGKVTPIYPANVAFRAIPVPAGVHEIRITYKPISFYLGAGLTLLTALGLCGWVFLLSWRQQKVGEWRIEKE